MSKVNQNRFWFSLVPWLAAVVAALLPSVIFASSTAVDDGGGSIGYTGAGWSSFAFAGTYNTSEHYTNASANYATFTFTGTSVVWLGAKWNNRGITDIYLDNVYQGWVDAYSAANLLQQRLFERSNLTNSSHTLKLVCTGTKNSASSDYYTDVDAFLTSTDAAWTGTKVDDGSTAISYAGTWGGFPYAGTYNTTESYSNVLNSSAQYTFTGSSIRWIGALWNNRGQTAVYLDGILQMTVDAYSASNQLQQVLFERSGLPNTSHTIKLVCLHVKTAASADYYTDVDAFEYGTAGAWTLATSDTTLTLNLFGNTPAITQLQDSSPWNWMPSPLEVPLLANISIGATLYHPNWTYTGAVVNTTSGTKVTFTFTSTTPALTLTQVWWAATGPGPVEETTSVTNSSGSTVTYQDTDVVSADLTVTADRAVTLWRFNRASVSSGGDPGFGTGVFTQVLAATTSVSSTISNDYGTGSYVLPFEMLDAGAVHGAYVGYENDFGNFTTSTSGNAQVIRSVFQMWSANSFAQATATTLALPGVFYGTYTGDTDSGSNKMKAWFWTNKMTPTLRTNTGEPLVEADCTLDSEANFTTQTPGIATVQSWGVELLKQDDTWTNDVNTDSPFGWDWNPNASYWPSGMDLGNITHSHSMKLSLYMANRHNHDDLSTSTGVADEKTAIETRFNGTATSFVGPGFDYWRTDMEFEPTADYLSHLGFINVMDYMITNHSGFRWENCSAGGSKKSFDLAQRESFGVVEDSGLSTASLTHLMQAYYPASYVFNPAQLGIQNADFLSGTNADGLYNFRTGFLGAWLWGIQAATWPGNTNYPTYVSLYKTSQRAILRGADVYHVLPMPTGSSWFGVEFYNAALNKGSVILLKPQAAAQFSPTIVLKGLVPTHTYTLVYQDRTGLNASVLGSTLMTTGISPISGSTSDVDSEIIWINY